jgi:hypothetical protein
MTFLAKTPTEALEKKGEGSPGNTKHIGEDTNAAFNLI